MIEIATFSLLDGVADEAFRAADSRVQTEFAYRQEGLVRRTTARSDDGRWLVLTVWQAAEDADRAAAVAGTDPTVVELDAMIDTATRRVDRFTPLD